MLRILVLGICIGGFTSALYAKEPSVHDQVTCRKIGECQDFFFEQGCEDLAVDREIRSMMITCSANEINQSDSKTMEEVVKSCGISVGDSVVSALEGIASLPAFAQNNLEKHIAENKLAQEICSSQLGYTYIDGTVLDSQLFGQYKEKDKPSLKWKRCYGVEVKKLRNYSFPTIPDLEELVEAASEVYTTARCIKPEAQAKFVCPTLASMVAGGVAGFAAKKAFLRLASRIGKGPDVSKYMDDLEDKAKSRKEILSIAHQDDLLSATESPAGTKAIREAGLDKDQMLMGVMDSDVGKIQAFWTSNIMTPSRTSDTFIRNLQGRGRSPAGVAMREVFDDMGFKGKGLLTPDLNPDQVRGVITKNPALFGYLHELPGLKRAMDDLDAGKITKAQFKTRVRANLFHNGPNDGFWKIFSDVIVGGGFSQGDDVTKKFFRNTVFDQGPDAKGVHVPKYPGATSPEGAFHTLFDRLSQGTRGGMVKIFHEVGGKPLADKPNMKLREIKNMKGDPAGLNNLGEVVIGNPQKTMSQVSALKEHLKDMVAKNQLSPKQHKALDGLVLQAENRLKKQDEFIRRHVRTHPENPGSPPNYSKIEISYRDSTGRQVVETITDDSPSDRAVDSLNRLMLAEERANGDPMRDLGKSSVPRLDPAVVLGSIGGAFVPADSDDEKLQCPQRPANTISNGVRRTNAEGTN
ncbi:MAG: hypothetical protein H6624_13065 [Bdellovibrionaceae bacterium]|nr:hypothetical protein [Bdellovibrionales bacterium]MCB9085273.1 hypothetical protein [Pseudobdellovibrionaceae bacterium]